MKKIVGSEPAAPEDGMTAGAGTIAEEAKVEKEIENGRTRAELLQTEQRVGSLQPRLRLQPK